MVDAARPNYITPQGAARLASELQKLLHETRPLVVQQVAEAAAQGDRSENAEYIYGKKRLREIDRRIRFLTDRLERAHVVEPRQAGAPPGSDAQQVYFGASVQVRDEEGQLASYHLVGEDETDPSTGRISWCSPIGRALMKRRVGDVVTVRRPAGEVELEVTSVTYG